MSHNKPNTASTPLEPRRNLHVDFTAMTLNHSLAAKRRAQTKRHIQTLYKETFSMKSFNFLRTVPGAALAAAVVITTGASAYALTNWFNGSVAVTQHHHVLSVDLSKCQGPLPPGVDSTDRHNVQFEILGSPHIAAADLQVKLLTECEYQAVAAFYHSQPALAGSSLTAGTVLSTSEHTITLAYHWANGTQQKTFALAPDFSAYNQGTATTLASLQAGDHIVFATQSQQALEGTDPLASASGIQSVFKTEYDTVSAMSASKNGFYQDNNIMPLDWYQQLHK